MGHSLERIRGKYKGEMLLGMNWVERWSRKVNIILFKFIKFCLNAQPPEGGSVKTPNSHYFRRKTPTKTAKPAHCQNRKYARWNAPTTALPSYAPAPPPASPAPYADS